MRNTTRINKALFGGTLISLLFLTFASQAFAQICVLSPAGLVSWWPGDGDAFDIADDNDGIPQSEPTFGMGHVTSGGGQAFSFDGQGGDHIVVTNSANLNFGAASFTMQYWFKSLLDSINDGHFSKTNGAFNAGGKGWAIRTQFQLLEFARASTVSPQFLPPVERLQKIGLTPPDVFHHIAVTYDFPSRTGNLYVDGSLADFGQFIVFEDFNDDPPVSTFMPSGAYTDSFDLLIGKGTGTVFEGLIDEVQIYDRALSSQEVLNIFNAGTAGICKDATSTLSALTQTVILLNLKTGIELSLDAKLDAVLQALQDANEDNDVAAIFSLYAFINAVEAQRGKAISDDDADSLVAIAEGAIAQLNL